MVFIVPKASRRGLVSNLPKGTLESYGKPAAPAPSAPPAPAAKKAPAKKKPAAKKKGGAA